jgi:hypothetical protein
MELGWIERMTTVQRFAAAVVMAGLMATDVLVGLTVAATAGG